MTAGQGPVVKLENVSKRYGTLEALRDVSFEVWPGEVVALLGSNGAGKTTALKCVLGITRFEGRTSVGGLDVRRQGKEARRLIGYVPQTPGLAADDTCLEALSFIAELHDVPLARGLEALASFGLEDRAGTRIGHLSGGLKQRLAVAAALLADPRVLLLDEPTASLDAASQQRILEVIARLREEGKGVVVATHDLDRLAALADRAVVLDAGRVVFAGETEALRARAARTEYIVSPNGGGYEALERALAAAGIDPGHIRPAAASWSEVLERVVAQAAPAEEEAGK